MSDFTLDQLTQSHICCRMHSEETVSIQRCSSDGLCRTSYRDSALISPFGRLKHRESSFSLELLPLRNVYAYFGRWIFKAIISHDCITNNHETGLSADTILKRWPDLFIFCYTLYYYCISTFIICEHKYISVLTCLC